MCQRVKKIEDEAKSSAEIAIEDLIHFITESRDDSFASGHIGTSFDGSWSHRRNAAEGTAEFMAPINPNWEKYARGVPVIAFALSLKAIQNIRDGNFEGSSQQMESNNLYMALNQLHDHVMQKYPNRNLKFDICIDGDLSSLSTLTQHPTVGRIFLDLTHKVNKEHSQEFEQT